MDEGTVKVAELRELKTPDLHAELDRIRRHLFDLRAQAVTEKLEDPSQLRKTRKDIKLGICGEHGGDPVSIHFCHHIGITYVSCSGPRVPVARLAAAHAAGVQRILSQYDNPLTREWLLNFLLDLGVERSDGELRFTVEQFLPKVKVDVVIADSMLDAAIDAIVKRDPGLARFEAERYREQVLARLGKASA